MRSHGLFRFLNCVVELKSLDSEALPAEALVLVLIQPVCVEVHIRAASLESEIWVKVFSYIYFSKEFK